MVSLSPCEPVAFMSAASLPAGCPMAGCTMAAACADHTTAGLRHTSTRELLRRPHIAQRTSQWTRPANSAQGSRRRPSQPLPGCVRTPSPTAHPRHSTNTLPVRPRSTSSRPLCPLPARSSWTSSAPDASPSPPSSPTPTQSSSARAARRSCKSHATSNPDTNGANRILGASLPVVRPA